MKYLLAILFVFFVPMVLATQKESFLKDHHHIQEQQETNKNSKELKTRSPNRMPGADPEAISKPRKKDPPHRREVLHE